MTIAYQLYCSRNFPPLDATLAMLAKTGFTAVEGFGGLYADPAALKAQLDAHGLHMASGHFGLDQLEDTPAHALNVAKTMGMSRVYCPWVHPDMRPTDAAGWRAFGQRLARAGAQFADHGLIFGWHNHDFELVDLGGVTPLDLIAESNLTLELDLGWVRVAGHDPVEWIRKYAGRITGVHIKDIAADGQAADEDGWADVGHGIQDWAAINGALKAAGIDHLVIEHDNPSDHARFAARSLASVKGW
jgi:sugar phosphate isomerase/epimerase